MQTGAQEVSSGLGVMAEGGGFRVCSFMIAVSHVMAEPGAATWSLQIDKTSGQSCGSLRFVRFLVLLHICNKYNRLVLLV